MLNAKSAFGIDTPSSCCGGDALHDERLDDVADFHVVVLLEADAALEAGLHLGHIVLETAQRADPAFVNDDVVAEKPRLGVARARDSSFHDHAARNRAELRD